MGASEVQCEPPCAGHGQAHCHILPLSPGLQPRSTQAWLHCAGLQLQRSDWYLDFAGLLDQAPHTCSLNLGQNQLGPATAQHLAAVLRWRPKVSKFRQSATNVLASLTETPREPLGEGFRQVRGGTACSTSLSLAE